MAALAQGEIHDRPAQDDMRLGYRDPTVSEFDFLPFTQEEPKRNFLDALRDAEMSE